VRLIGRVQAVACLGLLMAACGGAPRGGVPPKAEPPEAGKRAPPDLDSIKKRLARGELELAEKELAELAAAGSAPARLALGELYLETGRPEELLRHFPPPADKAAQAAEQVVLRAQARHQLGEVEEALTELDRAASMSAAPWRVRLGIAVLRGTYLLELGQHQQAEAELLRAAAVYGSPDYERASPSQRALALAEIGRAAHLLGAFQDANHAYEEAEQLAPASVELLARRAELFLEKYDTGHAGEVLDEAMGLSAFDAEVLYLRAALELETSMNFPLAQKLCERALSLHPRHQKARALLAGLSLRDLDFEEADRLLERGLTERPGDLDLLSVSAAVRFLAEDQAGFEAKVEQVLARNPRYARVFWVVSEYAEWEHRYADMERLLRRATRLDPEDGAVRGRLGLTLVRAGSDSAGVVELRRAFELDPYDVRVLNTLQLFETILPTTYVERRSGAFTYRVPKGDEQWLMRSVPRLLEEARADMERRYEFSPQGSTLIEIYAAREHFAVRTSGLPQIGIAGVCFGNKLATVSPRGSPGNLGMTLWHELGHVFHIGLSKSRVPRWLTEGLAEWETARLGRGWSRELDPSLFVALEQDRLPGFAQMNRAFTHAERIEDVAVAYYASGRMAAFLVQQFGMQKVQEVLASLGEHGLRPGVYEEILGEAPAELDQAFRSWLRTDLGRFSGTFVERPRRASLEEAVQAASGPEPPRAARLELARAELETGHPEPAEERLLDLWDEEVDAEVGFVLARLYLATDRAEQGLSTLGRVFAKGAEGADLRLLAAELQLSLGRPREAKLDLERATRLDPMRAETWALLASVEREQGHAEGELLAVRQWAGLSEHDGALHRRLIELLLVATPKAEDAVLAERAIWADLGNPLSHRLAARLYDRLHQPQKADFEWETALACPQPKASLAEARAEWAESLERRGQRVRAASLRRAASD